MKIYFGIDWDTKRLVVFWKTKTSKPQKIIFQKPSFKEVQEKINSIKSQFNEDVEIIAVIEDGAPQWNLLLHQAGVALYSVNTMLSARFRDSLSVSRAKDDQRDAKALLAMAQSPQHLEQITLWKPPEAILERLNRTLKTREKLVQRHIKSQQMLHSYLLKTMPCLSNYIQDVTAKWVLSLLKKINTSTKLANLTKDKLKKILSKTQFRMKNLDELWSILQDCIHQNISKELEDIEELQMTILIEELEMHSQHLSLVKKQMDKILEELPPAQSLCKIKGIGQMCSLILMQNQLTLTPKHRDSLSIKIGSSPVFIGSGSTRKGEAKGYVARRVSVSSSCKNLSYIIGLQLSRHSRWANAMFLDGKERGQRAGTIFRRITRSFLRIIQAILKSGEAYDEERYIDGLIKKGVPWAQSLSLQLSA